jgi:hypothetical protein
MAHIVQDDGNLCIDPERADLSNICCRAKIDESVLCVTGLIDEGFLCTDFSDVFGPNLYRADTTFITADNTSITADYHY